MISGLLIGITAEYYSSNSFQPVKDLVNACRTGAGDPPSFNHSYIYTILTYLLRPFLFFPNPTPTRSLPQTLPTLPFPTTTPTTAATNIIYGLALGYLSCIPPAYILAACIYISFELCDLYGVALAAGEDQQH